MMDTFFYEVEISLVMKMDTVFIAHSVDKCICAPSSAKILTFLKIKKLDLYY